MSSYNLLGELSSYCSLFCSSINYLKFSLFFYGVPFVIMKKFIV